jgi:hypothetical protein
MAAHDAAKAWRKSSAGERISYIERLAEVLSTQTGLFAELMARELGKPVRFGQQEGLASLEMLNGIVERHKQGEDAETRIDYFERRRPHGVWLRSHLGTIQFIYPLASWCLRSCTGTVSFGSRRQRRKRYRGSYMSAALQPIGRKDLCNLSRVGNVKR